MAGHSKFKNIMHRKGAQDAKRSKMFSKLAKEIQIAAKMGDPDPDKNPRLRLAVQTARGQSMPKDNIERAIKRSQGSDADILEEIRYEGFGPGGVALIVEALTDNRNRAVTEVRTAFNKNGGNMGESGSVGFMFDQVGSVVYEGDKADADTMFEAALEAGADNCESSEDSHEITCAKTDLNDVATALADQFGDATSSGLIWKPTTTTPLDEEGARKLFKMIEVLDDLDDVQNVYSNEEVSDDILAKLEEE
ncbi:MAG: YebC/PmpR family DNA-binding transcriptional regulator [Alphaproteobacteria bacterium]